MSDDTSPDHQRFLAHFGLLMWAKAVLLQAGRISTARAAIASPERYTKPTGWQDQQALLHTLQIECDFFVNATAKLFDLQQWANDLGLFRSVDFSPLYAFNRRQITDLRNMREHVLDYFQGTGHAQERWRIETPTYGADASSIIGSVIGGRLDYVLFASEVAKLLPRLEAEPGPRPPPPPA